MRIALRRAGAWLAIALLGAACLANAAQAERPFAVIVAADVADHHLSRETASLIFRRKQNYWDNGTRIHPVNLPATHPLRQAFSECVIGKAPEDMEDYWRQMYFQGVLPPHVLDSEEAVVLFVNSTPGAIGYVSACPKNLPVNVVMTIGDVPNCPKRTATCLPLQNS